MVSLMLVISSMDLGFSKAVYGVAYGRGSVDDYLHLEGHRRCHFCFIAGGGYLESRLLSISHSSGGGYLESRRRCSFFFVSLCPASRRC